jgi:hypothetical protein
MSAEEPWFLLHRIGDTDQVFYREIVSILNSSAADLAAKGQPISASSNGICCGKCASATGATRFYLHRELCGNIQAYIFDRELGHTEDGFEDRFTAFKTGGLTFKWQQGTDRKAQYLVRTGTQSFLNEEYKWEAFTKRDLDYQTPMAEKRVYHGKLKAEWAAPRGNRAKEAHPIRNGIADKWRNGGFARAFILALRRRLQGPPLHARWWMENIPLGVGWVSDPHSDLIAMVLQDDFRITLSKSVSRKLIKLIPKDGNSSIEDKSTIFFQQMKWEPLQFSVSIEEYLCTCALAERAACGIHAKLHMSPLMADNRRVQVC